MDIVYLAAVIVAAITLPRQRALVVAVGAWAFCVALVGWGPAKSDGVHVATAASGCRGRSCWCSVSGSPWASVLCVTDGPRGTGDAIRFRVPCITSPKRNA